MTADSNIFKLFRDPKIISQLLFEKYNSLEIKELTSDNANGKYVLHYLFLLARIYIQKIHRIYICITY